MLRLRIVIKIFGFFQLIGAESGPKRQFLVSSFPVVFGQRKSCDGLRSTRISRKIAGVGQARFGRRVSVECCFVFRVVSSHLWLSFIC